MKPLLLTALSAFLLGALVGGIAVSTFQKKTPLQAQAVTGQASVQTVTPSASSSDDSVPVAAAPPAESGVSVQPISLDQLKVELDAMETAGFGTMDTMRRWAGLSDRLRVSDTASLAAEMAKAGTAGRRETGWHIVMAAYAEKDPQGAWAFATALPAGPMRMSALAAAASSITVKDPDRALSLIEAIPEQNLKRQLRSVAFANLAGKDPKRALELALARDSDDNEDSFSLSSIFYQWARRDPEAAKAAALRIEGRQGDQARNSLVSALAQSDPKAAWEFAKSLPANREGYMDPRIQAVSAWAQSDPRAALTAALEISEAEGRNRAVSTAVSSWARSNPSEALTYAKTLSDASLQSDVLRALASNSESDPKALLDAVVEYMPAGDNYRDAVRNIFSNWARRDPAAAAAAVASLPAGRVQSESISSIAAQWVASGKREEALQWVRQLPEGQGRESALENIFSKWASDNPQQAIAAANALPADLRGKVIDSIASGWSRNDPQGVLRWAGSLTDAAQRRDVLGRALTQWADSSPESAAGYLDRLSAEDKAEILPRVVDRWASKNTEAAAEWLARQPAGPAKDSAIERIGQKIAAEDHETALSWAVTISDAKRRDRQVESLARDWVRQDAAAAKAWINRSSLPPETKARLLK